MDELARLALRRAELQREIDDIDHILTQHAQLRESARRLLSGSPTTSGERQQVDPQIQNNSLTQVRKRTRSGTALTNGGRRFVRQGVADFERLVTSILEVAHEPMDRSALLDSVTSQGLDVGGKDQKNTLGARMSRMSSVTNVGGRGYWLKSRLPDLQAGNF